MDRPNYRKVNVRCCASCKQYIEPDQMNLESSGTCGKLSDKQDNYVDFLCVCDNYEKLSAGSKRITKWYTPEEFNYYEDTRNEQWLEDRALKDSTLCIQRHKGKIALFKKESV